MHRPASSKIIISFSSQFITQVIQNQPFELRCRVDTLYNQYQFLCCEQNIVHLRPVYCIPILCLQNILF